MLVQLLTRTDRDLRWSHEAGINLTVPRKSRQAAEARGLSGDGGLPSMNVAVFHRSRVFMLTVVEAVPNRSPLAAKPGQTRDARLNPIDRSKSLKSLASNWFARCA